MLSPVGQDPSSPDMGWVVQQKVPVPQLLHGSEGLLKRMKGADGKPARGETFWRGLQLWLEVFSEGRRKVVASALG